MGVIRRGISSYERLENHFLGKRARRVNDGVCHEPKTIASVRDVEALMHVCKNPPDDSQDLHSALRSCALEADRKAIRAPAGEMRFTSKEEIAAIANNTIESYFVDRHLRSDGCNPNGSKFRGYGRVQRGNESYLARRSDGYPSADVIVATVINRDARKHRKDTNAATEDTSERCDLKRMTMRNPWNHTSRSLELLWLWEPVLAIWRASSTLGSSTQVHQPVPPSVSG